MIQTYFMANILDLVRCTVLDVTYEPRNVVSARRGLLQILKGKATMLEEHPSQKIRSGTQEYGIPVTILMKYSIGGRNAYRRKAQLTQKNLFIRDKYTCQYCGRHKSQLKNKEFLTRDHVHPIDKGGLNIWTNVVAACNKCNNKKANHSLRDLNILLLKLPKEPTIFEIWQRTGSNKKRVADLLG
jgi:hypothetical protein